MHLADLIVLNNTTDNVVAAMLSAVHVCVCVFMHK